MAHKQQQQQQKQENQRAEHQGQAEGKQRDEQRQQQAAKAGGSEGESGAPRDSAGKPSKLNRKKLEKLKTKAERRGVVYLSRLPPHLVRRGVGPLAGGRSGPTRCRPPRLVAATACYRCYRLRRPSSCLPAVCAAASAEAAETAPYAGAVRGGGATVPGTRG